MFDAFGQATSPILACAHLIYGLSPLIDVEQIFIHLDEEDVRLQLSVDRVQYNSILYINISDTHDIIKQENNYVIATLCEAGSIVTLSNEGISICSESDMFDQSFKCASECQESSYLFTRWEPDCWPCPPSGATCNGGNDVVLDYAYWAKVDNNSQSIGSLRSDVQVCRITFETYLCPAELCCNSISGCSFDGYNKTSFVLQIEILIHHFVENACQIIMKLLVHMLVLNVIMMIHGY